MNTELKFYTFGDRIERVFALYDPFGERGADIWLPDGEGGLIRSDAKAVASSKVADQPLPSWAMEAMAIAQRVGAHFDHMRVDFMGTDTDFWLGELTCYNLGGQFGGVPPHEQAPMDAAWDLRRSWLLTAEQTGWRKLYAEALLRRLNAQ